MALKHLRNIETRCRDVIAFEIDVAGVEVECLEDE